MKRFFVLTVGLQVALCGSFALAQDAAPSVDPAVAAPAAQPSAAGPDQRHQRHQPSPQDKCNFELRELAHHLRGVDAMVSRDGSITINTDREKGRMAKSDNALAGASKIEIYGKQGTSSVDGLSCAFDKSKKVGDGAAKLIALFQNEEKQFHDLMKERHPAPEDSSQALKRRHVNPADEFAQHVVQACAQVYPEVEALSAKLKPTTAQASTGAASQASGTASIQ